MYDSFDNTYQVREIFA